MLVSSGEDGVLHLWEIAHASGDPQRAEPIRTLRIDRPYERMNIRNLSGITEAQRAALIALGATEGGQYETTGPLALSPSPKPHSKTASPNCPGKKGDICTFCQSTNRPILELGSNSNQHR
jgi:hypothetical protein